MSYVVLKFDDLNKDTLPAFQMVHDYCKEYGVPCCFGLIGSSLMNDAPDEYKHAIKTMTDEGVELWNHGYFHTESEFSQRSYEEQKESINKTQYLMRKVLEESVVTFGSPHNNSIETTVKVLRDGFPEIENYFFMADATGKSRAKQLVMRCNYEIKTGVVDLDLFRKEYDRIRQYPYFVMQGHPSFWREEDFGRFKQMLDIMLKDGNRFVTAKELRETDISGFACDKADAWDESISTFFAAHRTVALYGAGEIGRELYSFCKHKGFVPDAFVVSDGHRCFTDIDGVPVFEFSEMEEQLPGCGIVPAVLGKLHKEIFDAPGFAKYDVWSADAFGTYEEFTDYVRYDVSVRSWLKADKRGISE